MVRVKGKEGSVFLILSIGDRPGEGKFARLVQTHPGPRRHVGLVRLTDLDELRSDEAGVGDGLSRLVVQSLASKSDVKGISVRAGATEFKPFQFRPLMNYLRNGKNRILIADEPGLGKTVSASYILIEEMANHPMDRILIACPPHLIGKWRGELWNRFGLSFDEVRGRELIRRLKGREGFKCIVSLNAMSSQVKMPQFRDEVLGCPRIDMLIVDEAHNLIGRDSESLRREFALLLSMHSDRVVALTATPLQIELMDLKRVFDIVSPGEWDEETFIPLMELQAVLNRLARRLNDTRTVLTDEDLKGEREKAAGLLERIGDQELSDIVQRTLERLDESRPENIEDRILARRELWSMSPLSGWMTRARRAEVGEHRKRSPITERIGLSTEETTAVQHGVQVSVSEDSMFRDIDSLLKDSFFHVHRRQLSSCLPAMTGLLSIGMRGFRCWSDGESVISDEELSLLSEDEAERFEMRRRPLDETEIERCKSLADMNLLIRGTDTKFDYVLDTIRTLRDAGRIRKAVVFAEWRPTMAYFLERMHEIRDMKCYHISGDDSDESRSRTLSMFQNHEGFAILFTADALAEGVDMQSADCIVNYDLPYNPQRVNQRIGRLDRIGQPSEEITVINPLVEGSTDEDVYDKLISRLDVCGEYVCEVPPIFVQAGEDGFRAEETEIAKEVHRQEEIRRLQEHDSINGLDDVLDSETNEIFRSRRCSFAELRILVLRDFFRIILGESSSVECDTGKGELRISGLTPVDAESLASLLPHRVADSARRAVADFAGRGRELVISTNPGKGDWYVPIMHPLMETAIRIALSCHYPGDLGIPTVRIRLRGEVPGFADSGHSILITEHAYTSQSRDSKEWKWWILGSDSAGAIELVDKATVSESLLTGGLAEIVDYHEIQTGDGLSGPQTGRIGEEHMNWRMQMEKMDCASIVRECESAVKGLEFELRRTGMTETDINGMKSCAPGSVEWRANGISSRIQSIRSHAERLKQSPEQVIHPIHEWRTVCHIIAGGDDD